MPTAPPPAFGLASWRWQNNVKSVLLLAAFPFLLLALLGVLALLYGWALAPPESGMLRVSDFLALGLPVPPERTPQAFALAAVEAWWPIVFGVAAAWVAIGTLFNDALIRAATGARPVSRKEAPELYNLLENLCISRGLKMPALHVIDTPVLNAYASGIGAASASVTVTRGLLERLDRDELEAVLAHELTHIINRDVRLLVVTIVFAGMLSFLAQMLWRGTRFSSFSNDRGRGRGGAAILLLVSALVVGVAWLLAVGLRLALSRRREYLADAGSVELTKNPEALIRALQKIAGAAEMPGVPSEVRQMFIENPPSAADFAGLFATHPPIESRIAVLRHWTGEAGEAEDPGTTIIPRIRR